jgi:hypothetical protein
MTRIEWWQPPQKKTENNWGAEARKKEETGS